MVYRHIDLTFLKQFTSGDINRMKRYIGMFLDSAPAGIESIQTYFKAKDWEQLRSAAHSLKPQIGYMGIHNIKDSIQGIEEGARAQNELDQLPDLIAKVEQECNLAFSELRDALENLDQPS